jgi:hypothetical protein
MISFPSSLACCLRLCCLYISSSSSCLLPCAFHMDSTFMCNENEFPVTLLGISDAQRQIHLLSIGVVSHRTQAVNHRLITSLQELVGNVMPCFPSITTTWTVVQLKVREHLVIRATQGGPKNVWMY